MSEELVECPICGAKVKKGNLAKHKRKVHGSRSRMRRFDSYGQRRSHIAGFPTRIRTKILREITPGKFLALGFGDIATSNLDGVIVSSFTLPYFRKGSAIGAIARIVGGDCLRRQWDDKSNPGDVIVIDLSQCSHSLNFVLFVVVMENKESGYRHPYYSGQETWLAMGLGKVADELLRHRIARVDVTAMGTQSGGIGNRDAFSLVSRWTLDIFSKVNVLDLVRITTLDLDTFIDLYDALYKLPEWHDATNVGEDIAQRVARGMGVFSKDVAATLQALEMGSFAGAITLCRTMAERKVKDVYRQYSLSYPGNFFNAVKELKNRGKLPPPVGVYFDTIRKLGNFATHGDQTFTPTRKDAEIIVSLTLRILEWNVTAD